MKQQTIFGGFIKKITTYPDGRTSLLTVVNRRDDQVITQHHVNLNVETKDVIREGIKYGDTVVFQADDFKTWMIGVDRFLGERQSNDKSDPKFKLPKLSEEYNPRWDKLGYWADTKALERQKIDKSLYLQQGTTPIFALKGFDVTSVCLERSAEDITLPAAKTAVLNRIQEEA